jgi:hypothetical protein
MIGDDLTPFFVPGEFAGVGDTLGGEPVEGIFDASYVSTSDGIGMASSRPAYLLPVAAAPSEPEGMVLKVAKSGEQFTVAAQEPDGTGLTVLILEKA